MSAISIRQAVGQVVLGVLVLLLLVPAAFAASITNGDFEAVTVLPGEFNYNLADVPGWTHTGAVGDGIIWHNGPVCCGGTGTGIAGNGLQWVTLGGGFGVAGSSAWSQTISGLVIGQSYVVSFMMASEGNLPTQTLDVGITSGSLTASQTFTSPVTNTTFWQNWGTDQYTFVPTATSATLQFSVTNQAYDVGLDNVSIAPVVTPEPSSLILLGSGLLGVLGAARRRLRV